MSSPGATKIFAIREMPEPAVMVHVQVRENDALDVARPDAERVEARANLLFRSMRNATSHRT